MSERIEQGIWAGTGVVEASREYNTTSDFYAQLNLRGKTAAVIGPWYLPYDVVGLQLAYNLGREGLLYSVDPQGDSATERLQEVQQCGAGSSTKYRDQLDRLRSYGLPLAPFQWLGSESRFTHIPLPSKSLDCVADHGTFEFLSTWTSLHNRRRSIEEVVRTLRPGGIWIHHWHRKGFLSLCHETFPLDTPFETWMHGLGLNVMYCRVENDTYVFPTDNRVAEQFVNKGFSGLTWPQLVAEREGNVRDGAIIFPERELGYMLHHVYIVQKIGN